MDFLVNLMSHDTILAIQYCTIKYNTVWKGVGMPDTKLDIHVSLMIILYSWSE